MKNYTVEVVIQNKPVARDPEGETIHRDLLLKGGYENVKSVRAGKYIQLEVQAEGPEDAEKLVFEMCNALRLYNPVVHTSRIQVREK
ncbi:phosphoribosylformylglycinamidine synthase subunit PurS [Candidatus Hecatella orcuttiae]|uniref:phosphoribosylformylglycinamidine synthase subunit PurS n=1 Tax=Candidatus Hecatella orcuttiae TaxID=1935119 RepID=UPI002867F214|nr:phosphoribosylformylglycinamidine synthase subunit PurS [Candidatus Hecatella orcuttiae]